MKKIFGVLSVFAVVIALTACGGKTEEAPSPSPVAQPSAEAPTSTLPATEDKGIFASIRDAISKSIPIKCSFTDKDGVKSVAYVTKDRVRVEAEKSGDMPATHGIVKDNKMYIWSELTDKGMVIDFSKITDEQAATMGEGAIRSTDDLIAQIERENDGCAKEVVSDSFFELPANIEFVNFNL